MTSAFEALAAAVSEACGLHDPLHQAVGVDWQEFLRLVGRHRVAPLLPRSAWLDRAAPPQEARDAIAARARRAGMRSLRMREFQREVLDALASAGVSAVALKGLPLAARAYGSPLARQAGDLDILVGTDAVRASVDALQAVGIEWLGFRDPRCPDRYRRRAAILDHPARFPLRGDTHLARDDLRLELHWRMFVNDRLMTFDPDWLAAPSTTDVDGVPVPTLPLEVEWLHVLVHGSNHFWARMKWLADVGALASTRPELVQIDQLERAARAGHGRSVATGLLVAETVFGEFLSSESRGWARSLRGASALVARSLEALAGDRDPRRGLSLRALPRDVGARLRLRGDWRYRVSELRLLALSAGLAHEVEDPTLAHLLRGPPRWVRRGRR
jgi:Uncharacterised nucleotidyltransferase